ncbi:hypothetical protein CJ030_MR8G005546 [Morella rubra]|uniref:Uncharacterized protein n=1 Tax=Morella rubra TaxID=262757 RepID=A0A6A1USF4_9ROSI|nr:hypothetical protein CJ030_MR8G005546 [Morella rubra]
MSDACHAMTNLCNLKVRRTGGSFASRGYNHEPPINQCIRWLSSLEPPLLEDQYENAVDHLLKDRDLQLALMAMPVDMRMVRLARLSKEGFDLPRPDLCRVAGEYVQLFNFGCPTGAR